MHIKSIISAQDAFAAMQNGESIVCRHIDGNFDSLDQFPATVFVDPDYEFAIKFPTQILCGFEFTRPLTLHEVVEDQDIFILNTSGQIRKSIYQSDNVEMNNSIQMGFAQRDADNAVSQLRALSCLLGFANDLKIEVVEGKKSRARKAKEEKTTEEKPEVETEQQSSSGREQQLESKEPELATTEQPDNIYDLIEQAQSIEYLEQVVAPKINEANRLLNDSALWSLKNSYAQRKEQLAQQSLVDNVEVEHQVDTVDHKEAERLKTEKQLIGMAEVAVDAASANALTRYTQTWTEEQRKHVLDAVNKRLIQLGDADIQKGRLIVRIQSANTTAELDVLIHEISTCDVSISDEIKRYFHDRKINLEALGK